MSRKISLSLMSLINNFLYPATVPVYPQTTFKTMTTGSFSMQTMLLSVSQHELWFGKRTSLSVTEQKRKNKKKLKTRRLSQGKGILSRREAIFRTKPPFHAVNTHRQPIIVLPLTSPSPSILFSPSFHRVVLLHPSTTNLLSPC